MSAQISTLIFVILAVDWCRAEVLSQANFTMHGDKGDYITGGQTYTYSTANGDKLSVSADSSLRGISVRIDGHNGDWWSADLRAAEGHKLIAGEYLNATRAPFSGTGPGIDIGGNGRGCNTIRGSFVVKDAQYGADGQVDRFEAEFEQHCEGGQSALRGRVSIGTDHCVWSLCGEACDAQVSGHTYLCDFRSCGQKKQFYCCQYKHCN